MPVSTTRLAQSVADEIRSLIRQDGLAPGDRLPTESALMARFEVGRSTIREAVKILQAENVVTIQRGKGSYVADRTGIGKDPLGLSFEAQNRVLLELMEVRLLLEPSIAAEAAARRTPADLEAMRSAVQAMQEAAAAGEDYEGYDYAFHLAMAESLHNAVMRRLYPVIFEAIAQGYRRTQYVHGSVDVALSYHCRILDAIRLHDAAAARETTDAHIRQAIKDINQNQ